MKKLNYPRKITHRKGTFRILESGPSLRIFWSSSMPRVRREGHRGIQARGGRHLSVRKEQRLELENRFNVGFLCFAVVITPVLQMCAGWEAQII